MHVYEFDENATDLTKVSPTQEPYEYERPTLIKDDSRDCREYPWFTSLPHRFWNNLKTSNFQLILCFYLFSLLNK